MEEETGPYEEWQLYLRDGDKLKNKDDGRIFTFKHYKDVVGKVTPPAIGCALFFKPYEHLHMFCNLNCWKPIDRRKKLERILK